MRQIEIGDVNRALLHGLDLPDQNDTKPSHTFVEAGMRLELTTEAKNILVSQLLGHLSYRNRQFIVRVIERIERDGSGRVDLFALWLRIGTQLLEKRHTVFVRAEMFEQWRRDFHDLDEDIIGTVLLAAGDASEHLSVARAYGHVEPWHTFARGDDRQLALELEQGIACQHLHLAGAYPAPYFWVAIMNLRFSLEILAENTGDRAHRYRQPDIGELRKHLQRTVRLRFALFEFATHLYQGGSPKDLELIAKHLQAALDGETESLAKVELEVRKKRGDKRDYATLLTHAPGHSFRPEEAVCPSLLGERMLLYAIFHYIARERLAPSPGSLAQLIAKALWSYVQVKNVFLGTIQQREGNSGFDYFEYTLRQVSWLKEPREKADCAEEIAQFLQESGAVIKLELMTSPARDAQEYHDVFATLRTIQQTMTDRLLPALRSRYGAVQVGLVVHFIKREGEFLSQRQQQDSYLIYHASVREEVNRLSKVLTDYLDGASYQDDCKAPSRRRDLPALKLCAIDAANRELHCPPEIFGPLYHAFLQRPQSRTFHVGEDFQHMMTGLRRIYEAIAFLGLRAGDRLGHCVALGANPQRWVHGNDVVSMHLIDQLDDAVFEWSLLDQHDAGTPARLTELERRIAAHSISIYGAPLSPHLLAEAWRRRAKDLRAADGAAFSDPSTIPTWIRRQGQIMNAAAEQAAMRRGTHNVIPNIADLAQVAAAYGVAGETPSPSQWPPDLAERLLLEYLYDRHTIERGIELSQVATLPDLSHIERMQTLLRREISAKGITVESNPSSNWLIGGFERQSDVPAVQWMMHDPSFPMTINPDDPVTFSTSIENEYFMVFACLLRGTEHTPGLSRLEALERIRHARQLALSTSFLS